MELSQIISAVIIGLISVFMLIYSFFTSKEKGPILSNTYIFATKEERRYMNKSGEYHLVTIVFGILGIAFLLMAIEILTSLTWINYIIGLLFVIVVIYAIVNSMRTK